LSITLPRGAIPAAVVFAILVPGVQSFADVGLSASEFASAGNQTLRAAGYAFSIWGLIYAGLAGYAVWQALARNRDDRDLDRIAPAALVAILCCGLWIGAAALDLKWPSVGIITVAAVALTAGLGRTAPRAPDLKDSLLVWWPLSLLAGWLTIATALNILTVLTAVGALEDLRTGAAFLGIVGVATVALLVLRTGRLPVYGAPIAWGLVAVWFAEKSEKPGIAALAMAAAVLVGCYAAWTARPRIRRR